ncbi:MAG: hypothetical protein A3J66_03880 [Candidatus Magasanikbacteria bacterium RIFCSPHIGHO2_02_FULL_47_14]|uniref:Uncharacterized protein n=1 Tax=Candidatus Magasanikbacteria bacterium RIFCSPHIGHO2_02_FULL_47_14 TaxID=1798680 RepID=A0A1F6M0V2_9BACT|nr:MAG: hypothetical protein A3J66_03880 [Candidatus Magasanikbacteria bacterium RIFCSPHIGHO2_02_FULL_47_14]
MNVYEDFESLKILTETEYKKIKSVYCPALKNSVAFNSEGFHHLRYDGSRSERSKTVQRNKFLCLKKARDIVEKSTTVQEYRRSICKVGKAKKDGFTKTSLVEWFAFCAITSFTNQTRIKVVIRRIGGEDGSFHFWSVIPYWTMFNGHRVVGTTEIEDK